MGRTDRTDRASRVIAAPPATVYRALLGREALEAWLSPDGMRGRVERWDPRPGDGFRMVLIYLDDTERLHPQAWAAPVTSDRHETEGQFSFDVPVCDPAGDLFVRLALVVRHFVATGYFTRGSNAFDPPDRPDTSPEPR
ncbi:SRPBCC domain-containing protein [Rhodococcus jostii]|uniref:Activator of Hsp90 ATPase homolog 1-like protein n=1 Tax=Rhodococcus jostii TaxID=132919 RepID=A0A1H5LWZ7_RHOJO|nr:SRPBCC domain-containing protein [Rhodococcus jostii]SEE81625.1 Activator of Hsp90 ATPase homolog 1-like protein [Rhodococcus jostii]